MNTINTVEGQGQVIIDQLSLNQIMDQTIALDPPQKTYSIFADMVLCATDSTSSASDQGVSNPPVLPISTTVSMLKKLVNGRRHQPNYDSTQAARWIRCLVQVVLDRRGTGLHEPSNVGQLPESVAVEQVDEKKNLSTVANLTEHALEVAISASAYPADELQWLATTLFNLAVDLYMSSPSSTGAGTMKTQGRGQDRSGGLGGRNEEDAGDPQYWASRAVRFADVLAADGTEGGDCGMLARTLRERCQRLKLHV